ncbi:glycosyltransferase family 2 protein [Streptomyces telluris]|uniref:Glycosyltransferase n=1 Tax=Streptomyces telluris TaxID=2720021 RepID=A0A9X2RLQ2_9ACTN|nr:glycosyltransferase [Streptomyces telluris]MCQ8771147.1 glycosyltransferase [Streptomyces telluris]NJP80712.1 glycosyltransferase [Streptomyces telluris]
MTRTVATATVLDGLRAHGNDYSAVERAFRARTGLALTAMALTGPAPTGPALAGPLDRMPEGISEPVSVVIATYNGARSLAGTLAGLESQLWRGFEVVVVDDGSDPPVRRAVLDAGAGLTVPVTVVRNSVSLGAGAARNIGLTVARGSTVIFLDDDMRVPRTMTGLLALRQQHTEGCLFTGFRDDTGPDVFFAPDGVHTPRIERDWRWISDRGGDRYLLTTADRDVPRCDRTSFELVKESRYYKDFGRGRVIGFWDLPGMVSSHSLCAKRADAVAVGGFPEEYATRWGAEDLAFGALMAASGIFVVPAPEWVSFHLRHEGRRVPRAVERARLEQAFDRYRRMLRRPLTERRFPRHRLRRTAAAGRQGVECYELVP